jgi:hypothetical protein
MESSGVPQTPPKDKIDKQVRFIATEAGITHFIQENVVFTFNGETISVDRYMNTSLLNEKDKKHAGFESYLEKVSNDLREAGYRALTSEEIAERLKVLNKPPTAAEKPIGLVASTIEKIFDKFGI